MLFKLEYDGLEFMLSSLVLVVLEKQVLCRNKGSSDI